MSPFTPPDGPADPQPYLVEIVERRVHNPDFPQDALCQCGHPYYRHFDTYEDMEPVGCKYCECFEFKNPEFDGLGVS